MFWIAYRMLKGRLALALLSVVAVALAIGLAAAIPMFTQAVSRAIMEDDMTELAIEGRRSPLTVREYLLPTTKSPISAQTCLDLGAHLAATIEDNLGFPVAWFKTTVKSPAFLLKTARDGPFGVAGTFLGNATLGVLSGVEDQIEIISGKTMTDASSGDTLLVWIHTDWAEELGLQADDPLMLQPVLEPFPINIEVAGTWSTRDPDSEYWPENPDSVMRTMLLVSVDDYTVHAEPLMGNVPVGSVSWEIVPDESRFVPEAAKRYVKGLKRAQVEIGQMVPDVQSDVSPLPILEAHLERLQPLMILLSGFAVPIIGFVLYFLVVVSKMLVDAQRRTVATIVSRGLGAEQVFYLSLYQGLILLMLGTPLGILIGLGAAQLMGHVSGFMRFMPREPLTVSLAGLNVWLVLAMMAVSLWARLWPTLRQSRWSVVEYTHDIVRQSAIPFSKYLYFEFLLIVPTYYAYDQLQKQGSIGLLGWSSSGDIFQDPLLFLVPALFMLTAALVAARLFPLLTRLGELLLAPLLSIVGCLTLRQLGRQGHQYTNALRLIMISLSVGVFMASMAASLDQWMIDRAYYPLGADVVFRATEEAAGGSGLSSSVYSGNSISARFKAREAGVSLDDGPRETWFVPLESFTDIEGVQSATWVGSYRASIPTGPSSSARGRYMAIDRLSFAQTASYRDDFSPASLGDLLNRLAMDPQGVLVSRNFLEISGKMVGDPLDLTVSGDGTHEVQLPTKIMGVYDLFPTVFEDDQLTVIGNLNYLLTATGGVTTYEIWLDVDEKAVDINALQSLLVEVVPEMDDYRDVWTAIAEERDQKERVGVYGTLSLGFLSCLALAGIGLLIQYRRSLTQRLSRFAILRAIGLGRGQLSLQVQLEYLIVLVAGVVGGVAIGVYASELFIPYFRVATGDGELPMPPLRMLLDTQSIVLMVLVFSAVQIIAQFGFILRTMQAALYQVLRLGNQD